jgi:hypothetical protein
VSELQCPGPSAGAFGSLWYAEAKMPLHDRVPSSSALS